MPVVLLRTSAAFLPAKQLRHARELGLGVEDLFAPLDGVRTRLAALRAGYRTDVDQERDTLNATYDALLDRARAVDPTLIGAVEARRTKALQGLDRLAHGFIRAAKRTVQVDLDRLQRIHDVLFPGGGLQERRDNIMPMLADRGVVFLDQLLEHLDPLDPRFTLLVEP
jgi:hypothetical protein